MAFYIQISFHLQCGRVGDKLSKEIQKVLKDYFISQNNSGQGALYCDWNVLYMYHLSRTTYPVRLPFKVFTKFSCGQMDMAKMFYFNRKMSIRSSKVYISSYYNTGLSKEQEQENK